MRPKYETAKHRKAEAEIMAEVRKEAGSNIKAIKLSEKNYYVDFALFNEKEARTKNLIAYAEIKDRPGLAINDYNLFKEGYMLSAAKYVHGITLAKYCKVPFFLIVRFANKDIKITNLGAAEQNSIGIGGRTDREDKFDREPCIYIPITGFYEIKDFFEHDLPF